MKTKKYILGENLKQSGNGYALISDEKVKAGDHFLDSVGRIALCLGGIDYYVLDEGIKKVVATTEKTFNVPHIDIDPHIMELACARLKDIEFKDEKEMCEAITAEAIKHQITEITTDEDLNIISVK